MSEVTFIKGKDASLEASIENLQTILKEAEFEIEEASWLNPVNHVFSVHIRDKHCPGLFTNGKGTSRKATLASALGEFLERLSTNYFFSDYWLEPDGHTQEDWVYYPNEKAFELDDYREVLTPGLWDFYDPDRAYQPEDLLSLNDSGDRIRALPLREESTGESVFFPANLLSNLYASNGLSAGNSHMEAQVQGLSEVFERWVKNRIMRENLCLPVVPESVIEPFHAVTEARDKLKEAGIEVSIRDASLGQGFPVVCIILFERSSGRCFASFGAHPIFEVALERTLTESLQGRQLGHLDGFQTPVFDEEAVADDENIENHFIDSSGLIHARFISDQADFDYCEWDFSGPTQMQWQQLVNLVHQQGSEVYVGRYDHYDFPACRIIVPGMSEIYPCEELVESNHNMGRDLRRLLLKMDDPNTRLGELLEEIEGLGFGDHEGVASLIGLMPDPGSFWSKIKITDLRFWLALASQDHELALESVQEALLFTDPQSEEGIRYKAFEYCLELFLDGQIPFSSAQSLFDDRLIDKVRDNIEGRERFFGEPTGLEIFKNSNRHQAMLNIYQRTRKVKQARL